MSSPEMEKTPDTRPDSKQLPLRNKTNSENGKPHSLFHLDFFANGYCVTDDAPCLGDQ